MDLIIPIYDISILDTIIANEPHWNVRYFICGLSRSNTITAIICCFYAYGICGFSRAPEICSINQGQKMVLIFVFIRPYPLTRAPTLGGTSVTISIARLFVT